MRAELRSFLLADAAVASASGARITWEWRKQGTSLPAITLTRTDGRDDPLLEGGASGLVESHVQVDCWGALPADTAACADAVRAALRGLNAQTPPFQGAFVEGERDTFEGEAPDRIFRTMLTVRVWHADS